MLGIADEFSDKVYEREAKTLLHAGLYRPGASWDKIRTSKNGLIFSLSKGSRCVLHLILQFIDPLLRLKGNNLS
ncbi:hypothetical protein P22_3075 [Propionispora sp. 2/2-37]|uniref:hypothetical protein n=1 Tax=Propionispora sp. 2/2-37 TaxID=1677858 RepID=UPI0006C4372E|nr:hypothetical protein [Propionispora sp. 2/2-37]CUH96961.1 hypothetical protein P22_3075 [Propionispora sp. 2/2-37]